MQQVTSFLQEAWLELGKVVWPTREQTVRLTVAVLAITAGMAVFTSALDYLFNQMLNLFVAR